MRLRDILTLGLRAQDALKVEEAGETGCDSWKDDRVGCANSTRCYWVEATGLPNNMMGCFPESNFKDLCEKQWCGHLKPAIPAMVTAGRAVVSRCSKHRNGCSFEEMVPNDDDELFESILALGCKNDHKTELSKEEMSTCKTRLRSAFFYGEQCVHKKQLEPLCLEKNTNYLGGRLQVIALNKDLGEEKGIAECNKSCKDKNENCTMWTYESATGLCALRGSLTEDSHRVMKTVRRGFTSGLLCTPPNPTEEESNLSEVRARRECRQDCTICISCSDEVKEKQEQACALCKNYNVQFGKLQKQNTSGLRKRVRYRRKGVVSKTLSGIIGLTVQSGLDRILTKYVPNDGTKSGLQQCRELCLEHKECQFAKFFDFYCKLFKGVTFSGSMPTLGYESASFWLKYNRVSCGGLIHAALQSSNSSLFEVIDLVVTENPFCANDCQNFFGSGASMLQTKVSVPPGTFMPNVPPYMRYQIRLFVVRVVSLDSRNRALAPRYTVLEVGPRKYYTIAKETGPALRTRVRGLRPVAKCMVGDTCEQSLVDAWPNWVRSGSNGPVMPGRAETILADTKCTSAATGLLNPLSAAINGLLPGQYTNRQQFSEIHVNRLCANVGALVAVNSLNGESGDRVVACTTFRVDGREHLKWFGEAANTRNVMITSADCFKQIGLLEEEFGGKLKAGVVFRQCSDSCSLEDNDDEKVDLSDENENMRRISRVLLITKDFAIFTINGDDGEGLPLDVDSNYIVETARTGAYARLALVHFYRNYKQKITQYTNNAATLDAVGGTDRHYCVAQRLANPADFRTFLSKCHVPGESGGGPFFPPANSRPVGDRVVGMMSYQKEPEEGGGQIIPIYHLLSQGFIFRQQILDINQLYRFIGGGGYIDCTDRGTGYDVAQARYAEIGPVETPPHILWENIPDWIADTHLKGAAEHIVRNFKPDNSKRHVLRIYEIDTNDLPRYFAASGMAKIATLANDDRVHAHTNLVETDSQGDSDTVVKECNVCCFMDENDENGRKMSCSKCLNQTSSAHYPRLEHEGHCKQPTPAPTRKPEPPEPLPFPVPRCKLPKPFQPIPTEVTVFNHKMSVCPLLAIAGSAVVGISSKFACYAYASAGATECEIAGGGPEDPAADACAGIMGYFGFVCANLVGLGATTTLSDFLAFAGCEAWCPTAP
mmetsp:Transcript_33173/g.53370  ORF Transcript_33173/g.53370 Transcript_33173/m.53370 type:complete len:1167 (-) Transcript_33173:141-3641(-)